MACALPLAIGAQTAYRDRQVVALAGDGGLAMMFGELLTLIQNRLPVKVIVFNNSSLNFVELEMKAAGIVNFGTDLVNPDFAAIAQAMGIFGRRVEEPSDLEAALVEAFEFDGPAIIDVVTARQELSIPPAITVEQAKASRFTRSGRFSPGGPTSCSTWRRPMWRDVFSTEHPLAAQILILTANVCPCALVWPRWRLSSCSWPAAAEAAIRRRRRRLRRSRRVRPTSVTSRSKVTPRLRRTRSPCRQSRIWSSTGPSSSRSSTTRSSSRSPAATTPSPRTALLRLVRRHPRRLRATPSTARPRTSWRGTPNSCSLNCRTSSGLSPSRS